MKRSKDELRIRRHWRVRKRVSGTSERPRLAVFRSVRHMYAQLIDDTASVTMAAASTLDAEARTMVKTGGNIDAAAVVGKLIGQRAAAKGIETVVFDRGGFLYHGRIKALADAAREAGLKF